MYVCLPLVIINSMYLFPKYLTTIVSPHNQYIFFNVHIVLAKKNRVKYFEITFNLLLLNYYKVYSIESISIAKIKSHVVHVRIVS